MKKITYAHAGVDLGKYDGLMRVVKKELAASSKSSGGGLFAGMLELKGKGGPAGTIVASVDGVGTKVKVAKEFGRHGGIGRDIVAHCVNDILCLGGRPIAFMDYLAFDKIDPRIFKQILRGIAGECRKHGIQLIGGETAEMPGVYRKGEYDLVGFIIGLVPKRKPLDGSRIRKGNLIVGLPSSGLHTNGFSLARRVLLAKRKMKLDECPDGWRQSLGKVLLKPHANYFTEVYPLVEEDLLTGIAHITGGGIAGNLARVLPGGCGAMLKKAMWHVPDVFELIMRSGPVGEDEMFRVFNMGLGMLLIVPNSHLPAVMKKTRSSRIVGEIVEGGGEVTIE
jgi:phosphoribosylformylglycinamidine cyclo-ligase